LTCLFSKVLRYIGACHLGSSTYVGIELAEGTGEHDGSSGGHRYFECEANKGLLLPVEKIKSKVAPAVTSSKRASTVSRFLLMVA